MYFINKAFFLTAVLMLTSVLSAAQTPVKTAQDYINTFNKYFNESRKPSVTVSKEKCATGKSLPLTGKKTGLAAGYMCENFTYDEDLLAKSLAAINEGITKYPDRLDMRFGKAAAYDITGDDSGLKETLKELINRSKANKNNWLDAKDGKMQQAQEKMLDGVQEYLYKFFQAEKDEPFKEMSEYILNYYPSDAPSLNNMASYYMMKKEYEKAIPYLLKAHSAAPKDDIITANLAQAYHLKGDEKNAKIYGEKLAKSENPQSKKRASDFLNSLK